MAFQFGQPTSGISPLNFGNTTTYKYGNDPAFSYGEGSYFANQGWTDPTTGKFFQDPNANPYYVIDVGGLPNSSQDKTYIDQGTLSQLQGWAPNAFQPAPQNPFDTTQMGTGMTMDQAMQKIGLNPYFSTGQLAANQGGDQNFQSIVQNLRNAGLNDQQIVQAAATNANGQIGQNQFDWGDNYNRILQNAQNLYGSSVSGLRGVNPLSQDIIQGSRNSAGALMTQLQQSANSKDPIGDALMMAGTAAIGGLAFGAFGPVGTVASGASDAASNLATASELYGGADIGSGVASDLAAGQGAMYGAGGLGNLTSSLADAGMDWGSTSTMGDQIASGMNAAGDATSSGGSSLWDTIKNAYSSYQNSPLSKIKSGLDAVNQITGGGKMADPTQQNTGLPFGNVIGGLIGAYGANKAAGQSGDLMNTLINSDLFRSQQPKYFDPLYNAATGGLGNTAYGKSLLDTIMKKDAARGITHSGNFTSDALSALNSGTVDYMNALRPLAMGNSPYTIGSTLGGIGQQQIAQGQQTIGDLSFTGNQLVNQLPGVVSGAKSLYDTISSFF